MSADTTTRPPVEVVIYGVCEGYQVEIGPLRLPIDQLAEACRRLAAAGIGPAPAPSAATNGNGSKAKAPRVPPQYDDQGNECCPHHGKVLKEGKYGLYCPSKDDGPTSRNGYCSYSWKQD